MTAFICATLINRHSWADFPIAIRDIDSRWRRSTPGRTAVCKLMRL